ncbi:MAG: hypothetical protein ACTSRS_11375 [Candidatus Helarchaeota archaeon]
MKLEVKTQFVISLKSEKSTHQIIRGAFFLFSGLTLCFISLFLVVLSQLLLGVSVIIVGIIFALLGVPPLIRNEALVLYRNGSRIIELVYTRYYIFPAVRVWDMDLISKIEGQVISRQNNINQIIISLKFTNGTKEVVLSEPGEVIPNKCLNYLNQFIEGKEIPEREFWE